MCHRGRPSGCQRRVGPLSLLAFNDNEDGLAKNRRVELVRQ